jgi:hypothetical protein
VPYDAYSFAVAISLPPAFWGRSFALFELLGVLLAHFSASFGRLLGSFLGTFVDSKGLLRFVPSELTSFLNFPLVSGTFGAALLEHTVAGIAITLTSQGSSLMKISPASLASQGR